MKSKFFRILGVVTVVAMLAGTLTVAPALGLSAPNVALTTGPVALAPNNVAGVISNANIYTLTFNAGAAVPVGGFISIVFPATTKVSTLVAANDVIIEALAGIGGGPIASVNAVYAVTGTYPAAQTLKITVPAAGIGAGSLVGLTLGTTNGIINPSTAGSFTLTVATTTSVPVTIEAATTSAAYTIINPVLVTPPGVVKVYNASGILLSQAIGNNTIEAAVLAVTAASYTIELGPGVYVEDDITLPAAAVGLIIKASGAKADTIVPARWIVNVADVTFKGLTLKSDAASGVAITVGALGNNVTIDGCDFVKFGDATTVTAQKFIVYGNTTALGKGTITNCTLDATLGAAAETVIDVSTGAIGLTISKNTFKLDLETTYYSSDYGISTAATVTITENTFTGYANFGKAIRVTDGTATITKNIFTGVKQALQTTTGTAIAKFTGNTVDASGYYSATTATLNDYVFLVTNTGGLTVAQNKITNSKYYVAYVAAGDTLVNINFNEFSGNAYGVNNAAAAVNLNATHNWWGAATGPVAGHNTLMVDASGYLGAVPSNGAVALACANLTANTTAGVVVDTTLAGVASNVTMIGVASYATNPGAVAPASTLTVKKYFDVFVTGAATPDTVSIKFYGTITANSQVWFYSPLAGTWAKCSIQSPNTTSGFVVVTITATTSPTKVDLSGTAFVLVEAPPEAPAGAVIAQSPTLGKVDVPIDTTFTWGTVPGAVSYVFEIAEEIGQIDKFYLKDAVGSSAVNAYKLLENLKYDTQYWWRVQAVNAVGAKSAWTVAFFTTAKEPAAVVPPTPPVVIQQNPPAEITLEIPASPSPVQPIPSYLLWAVIGVGAVLVIAVIVLIVRTRRIS